MHSVLYSRRRFLGGCLSAAVVLGAPLAVGELLTTPPQSLGPFYPAQLPLDRDNDLLRVAGQTVAALGEPVQLHGRILDARGEPLGRALVEIWQADSHGVYLAQGGNRRDAGFQGYGCFETASGGEYRFRTLRPRPYPGRTAHIHMAVTLPGQPRFVTQCYVRGEPGNAGDYLLSAVAPEARERLLADFLPAGDGELAARFDIVLGLTPADA
ncbi:twin-arginine translocation signal domain-containing protein [Pseudomonas sp. UL073]|uniref:Twin-arginine translocation signal domain-containing protein n=1 Tax=Zestomonas insulae TaxID=2809017 RepID=A0ABS2IGW5_9GAMM|nr:protocatechuate 3,4-dioxygenase [Pseudomonas insulae]MBM7062304.1 twin-arginine translocation signal domain-containing protein [Pseudomonas insulae]